MLASGRKFIKEGLKNIQYAVLSMNDHGKADMDGECTFTETAVALNAAYGLYKIGVKLICILAIDFETGETVPHEYMDRATLNSLMGDFEIAEHRAEDAEKRHGTYPQQHIQRTSDVIGRA